MAHDEKLELLSNISGNEVGLLDSIFELLKGSRDQECQRALFGIYEDEKHHVHELNSDARIVQWWNQLCSPEVQALYRRNKNAKYDHNHLFSGFINPGPNRDSERIYEKYLKPGLQNDPKLIEDQRMHLLFRLEQGVVFGQFWNDMALKGSAVSRSDFRDTIEKSSKQLPEKCWKAVFGSDGIRNRFLLLQLARRSRVNDGGAKNGGHRKKAVPGPYEVLRRKHVWFVTRASRGYLARCTDPEIFFGVLAAAFILGLNLDGDKEIDRRVEAYLKALVGGNQDIEEFKLLLTEFFAEENAVELRAGSYRLGEAIKMLVGSDEDKGDLAALIQRQRTVSECEIDQIRNLYLDWLEKRVEGESLFRELAAGGLDTYFKIKNSLDSCIADMNHLKTAADERLDRLLKQNGDEKKAVAQITAQTPYTIEF